MKSVQDIGASLKYRIHKKLATWEGGRDHSVVHASDVTKPDFCPRQFALLDGCDKKPKGQFIGTSLRVTFDLGNALQSMLNNEWADEWCIGTWECRVCNALYRFQKRPLSCTCGKSLFVHKEENFISQGTGVSGSVDYLFDPGGAPYIITEVKTMVKDEFKTLLSPLAEHRDRTRVYLRLVSECNDYRKAKIDLDKAMVFYICKGFGCADNTLKEKGISDAAFSPFKEFVVTRDDSSVDHYFEKAREIHSFRNGGGMPGRVCNTSVCTTAKGCPVRTECWS